MEKRIRLSIEDEKLQKLRQSTEALLNDMIRSSRQYTTSSKETLRDLEEQIKLIEKRNALDKEMRTATLAQARESGAISPEQYTSRAAAIRGESREDKIQTQLLRELIETIRSTAKEEIRSDRIGVERRIRADQSLSQLGISGDPQVALRRTIQRGMIGDINEQEGRESSGIGRRAANAFNTGAGLATSKNEFYAMAGLLGLIPLIGQGASQLATRFLGAGEAAETSTQALASTMPYARNPRQTALYELSQMGGRGEGFGLNAAEGMNRYAGWSRAGGIRTAFPENELEQLFGAEKFIGSAPINQLAGITRYGGGSMSDLIRTLEAGNRDVTRLTEDVSNFIGIANTSLSISSNADIGQISRNLVGIQRATGMEGTGLQNVSSAIQGLGRTSNPQVRSLMMRAFRQANPNASVFDLQAMMEDPLSNMQSGGGQFFESLKGLTGGGEMYKQVLHSVFGGNISRSRINDILSGGGDFTQIAQEIAGVKGGDFDFSAQGKAITGVSAVSTAQTESLMQEYGLKTLEFMGDTKQQVIDIYNKMSEYFSDTESANDESVRSLRSMNANLEKINNNLTQINNKTQ